MRAWLAWSLFAALAALLSAAVLFVTVRAASAERARVHEERLAERAEVAAGVKRDVEAALAEAKETLRVLEPGDIVRLEAHLIAKKPAFADVFVRDADGQVRIPAPSRGDAAASPECEAARAGLHGADRAAVRARIVAECPDLRSESGRALWPLLALETIAAGAASPDALVGWLELRGARLEPSERRVLATRAGALPAEARAAVVRALERSPSPLPMRVVALSEGASSGAWGAGIRVHRGEAVSLLRALSGASVAGYVVHEASLLAAPLVPEHLVLASGARGDATDVSLAPGLVVHVAPRDPAAMESEANRARVRVVGAVAACVIASVALAAVLFGKARRAQRLAELRTDFVAAVSHELRTPVASVRMLAELLEQKEVPAEERDEVEGVLAGEARRLASTLERMLRFGALARGKLSALKSNVRVRPLLEEARARLLRTHPEKEVVLEAPPELTMDADAALVGLVLDNLLSNAAKYAPDGGPYRVRAAREGRWVVLSVADAGPGVDRRTARRIFSPFERADDRLSRATEGTGIGLALVRGIAREHGGDAHVEAGLGEGATFVIRFPLEVS